MAIQELVTTLQELGAIHQELLELAEQKKDVIVQNLVDQLNSIVNKEAKLLRRVGELEEQRVLHTNRFLAGKGYRPDPGITLTDLVRIVFKSEERRALLDAQRELTATLEALREANQLNQELIKNSLMFIDYSLNLMVGAEDEATYQNPLQQQSGYKRASQFDTRA